MLTSMCVNILDVVCSESLSQCDVMAITLERLCYLVCGVMTTSCPSFGVIAYYIAAGGNASCLLATLKLLRSEVVYDIRAHPAQCVKRSCGVML